MVRDRYVLFRQGWSLKNKTEKGTRNDGQGVEKYTDLERVVNQVSSLQWRVSPEDLGRFYLSVTRGL